MIEVKATAEMQPQKIEKAADKATYNNLRHAGFSIGKAAKASILKSREPSEPGKPPTTRGRGRKNLRAAIFTSSDKESVIVGPRASYVGDSGEAHEFGKRRLGDSFDERPFMAPALAASLSRFARDWQGTIGE